MEFGLREALPQGRALFLFGGEEADEDVAEHLEGAFARKVGHNGQEESAFCK
jgi:hypothetical protein